jgi:hypothetical protein
MNELAFKMPGPYIPDHCDPSYMKNCARVSFDGCVEKKIDKNSFICSKMLPGNFGRDDLCEEMNL